MIKKLLVSLLALFAAAAFAAVDANKADQAALESIKGIGPSISGKIIDERKRSPYKDWADLIDRVSGIGEGNAAKFSGAGLTVNGASFKGASAKPKTTDAKKDNLKTDAAPAKAAETKAEPKATKTGDKAAPVDAKASAPKAAEAPASTPKSADAKASTAKGTAKK